MLWYDKKQIKRKLGVRNLRGTEMRVMEERI